MLLATGLPTEEDRAAALAAVPWQADTRSLAGLLAGTLRNQAVKLIDIAVGTAHARAAIVALQEGVDAALQAAIELAESVAAERYFARNDVFDPLGSGDFLREHEGLARMRTRFMRVRLEDAAIRLAAAGNHLVNAHLRLAWEANAATEDDVRACGFDPAVQRSMRWAGMEQFRRGLVNREKKPSSVFSSFVLNEAFESYIATPAVAGTWDLRDQIVHRDRPSYREAPAFGRASLWTGGFTVRFPPPDVDEDPDAPTIGERRQMLSQAGAATLDYASSAWAVAQRWLRTVDVFVEHSPPEVKVQVNIQPGATGPRIPRERRDPGPFLVAGARTSGSA